MLFTNKKSMHWSLHRALRDINKKGVEIGERQNKCHNINLIFRDICIRIYIQLNAGCIFAEL